MHIWEYLNSFVFDLHLKYVNIHNTKDMEYVFYILFYNIIYATIQRFGVNMISFKEINTFI